MATFITAKFNKTQVDKLYKYFKQTYDLYTQKGSSNKFDQSKNQTTLKKQLNICLDKLKKAAAKKSQVILQQNPKDREQMTEYQNTNNLVAKIISQILENGITSQLKDINKIGIVPVRSNLMNLKKYLHAQVIQTKNIKGIFEKYISQANQININKKLEDYFKGQSEQNKIVIEPVHKYVMKLKQSADLYSKIKGAGEKRQEQQIFVAMIKSLEEEKQTLNNKIKTQDKQIQNIFYIVEKISSFSQLPNSQSQQIFQNIKVSIDLCFKNIQPPLTYLLNTIKNMDNFTQTNSTCSIKSESTNLIKKKQTQKVSSNKSFKPKLESPVKTPVKKNPQIKNTPETDKITFLENEIEQYKKNRQNNQQCIKSYGNQVLKLSKNIQTADQNILKLEQQIINLKDDLKNQQSKYSELYSMYQDNLNQMQKMRNQIIKDGRQSNKSNKKQVTKNPEHQILQNKVAKLYEENSNLKCQIDNHKRQMTRISRENKQQMANKIRQNEQLQRKHEEVVQIINSKNQQIIILNRKIQLKAINNEETGNRANMQNELTNQAKVKDLIDKINQLTKINANFNAQINQLNKKKQNYQSLIQFQNQSQTNTLAEFIERQQQNGKRFNILISQHTSTKQELSKLEQQVKINSKKLKQSQDMCQKYRLINLQLKNQIKQNEQEMKKWNWILQTNSQKDIANYRQKWAVI